ncbi:stage II sporulation protein R [Paenibacillus sp. ACRRX]|uniref:stage II sporulation protein R n=1 Tax=Paenibacillus sp. ACRRX TaxID=2918206 RepID=UPI001EF5787E|nr:stage II sporulation protein R [Paenibacillus sp. ACRRX]MCG7408054.1 stage II sporulation protein R [Paenibacillus sp. ACRRX]
MRNRRLLQLILLSVILAGAMMSWDLKTVYGTQVGERKQQSNQDSSSIPGDAIRLRILAHSDSSQDQKLKREVRDRVVEQMNMWLNDGDVPETREQARVWIESHMDHINDITQQVVNESGKTYKVTAELKEVPFPAKLYGGRVYPAGIYEALRITLGEGKGQNWWCVLFPPLCFVDGEQGTAIAKVSEQDEDSTSIKKSKADEENVKSSIQNKQTDKDGLQSELSVGKEKEVRFFLWDMLVALGDWIGNLFRTLFG